MKVIVKAPFFNSYGLFKKGDVIDVKEKDFDATLMDPAVENSRAKEETEKPAKKTAGKKKA